MERKARRENAAKHYRAAREGYWTGEGDKMGVGN